MSFKKEKPLSPSPVGALPVEDDIMDGGRAAWSTVMGGFLTVAVTFGYTNSFGVYQDLYTRSHTASASAVSWIGSTQIFFLLAMALPGGKLLDMGYFRITTLVGSLIYVFSLFMLSICHMDKFWQLYLAQGLGMGIGSGLLALAMGIVATGSSLGGIIFPIMLNRLFKGSAGFAWGVRASAFIVLGLLIFANLLMKPKPRPPTADHPKLNLKEIITDKPYLICIFSVFIIDWGLFFPYFYFQLFAVLHGIDAQVAFFCVAILNAGAIPGRIIPNMLADYFGTYNIGIPMAISCGILIFAMIGVKTVAGMVILAILYGFTSGAVLALTAPAFAVLARDPSEVGVRFGIAFSLTSVGALMGGPIDGALLGKTFPWIRPITFSGVSVLAGVIGLVITRQMLVKRKGTQIV